MKKLDRLLELLLAENHDRLPLDLPKADKESMFRSLCNVRRPLPVSPEFLSLQDEYLQEKTRERGIVNVDVLTFHQQIVLWQGDITRLNSDAIVNAGNADLLGCFSPLHNCIDNIIHHNVLYDNEQLVKEMIQETKDCAIPTALVPVCPVCGGPMDVNVHKDAYFVEDAAWDVASERYALFLQEAEKDKIVFLELGVGYNTPGIIRYPFEQMTHGNKQAVLIGFNQLHPEGAKENRSQTIAFTEEMSEVMAAL